MSDTLFNIQTAIGLPLPLFFACIAALTAAFGVFLAALKRSLANRVSHWMEIFSGIILLGVGALHLALHALEEAPLPSLVLMTAGAFLGYVITHLAQHSHGEDAAKEIAGASLASVIAIGIHSLLDGGVYVASLEHEHAHIGAGVTVSIGLILHEASEGVIAFFLSLGVFRKVRTAIISAIAAASLTTPLGTVLMLWAGGMLGEGFFGVAYPLASGFIGFAGASLLWPHIRRFLPSADVRKG